MGSWNRFNETKLPKKEESYSNLNMDNITDADYKHVKRVLKDFQIKDVGHYHDPHVQIDTLLVAEIFENFCNKCIETYEIDPAHFLSAPELVWQVHLKKTKI